MAGIQKFSAQVIDYAERLSGMADAAEGKGSRRDRKVRRWVVLPASGAALLALVRSDFFSRQAKEVMDEAKTRASELPDDLMSRVRQTADELSSDNGSGQGSSRAKPTRKRTTRKAAGSTRKPKAVSR